MVTPNDKPTAIAAAENQAAAIAESHLEGLIDDSERHQHITRIWQQTTDDVKAMVEAYSQDSATFISWRPRERRAT